MAYLMKVEMAGRAFVSAASEPFFLGSEKHKAAIAGLPDHKMTPAFDLADSMLTPIWNDRDKAVGAATSTDAGLRKYTTFTVSPTPDGYFYKIKEWKAYHPRQLIRCIRA